MAKEFKEQRDQAVQEVEIGCGMASQLCLQLNRTQGQAPPSHAPLVGFLIATLKISQLCLPVVDQLEFIVFLTLFHDSFCSLRRKDY